MSRPSTNAGTLLLKNDKTVPFLIVGLGCVPAGVT